MRKTSDAGDRFPWTDPTVCFIEQSDADGTIRSVGYLTFERQEMTERAARGDSHLFAVWPGQQRSDLFEVDDLGPLMLIHGVEEPDPAQPEPEPEPVNEPIVIRRCGIRRPKQPSTVCRFHEGHDGKHSWEG